MTDVHPKDIDYPDEPPVRVRDAGETFDLVVRKGPISLNGLMDQICSYSQDDVYSHLKWLVDEEYLTRREGDLYEVHPSRVEAGGDA